MFRMISEAQNPKPETIVFGNCVGIREREVSEVVHHRENEGDTHCSKCGKVASMWLESDTRWEMHTARCAQ